VPVFLIEYDRKAGRLIGIERFEESNRRSAYEARLELEIRLHRENVEREVVLLEAASERALRVTHGRYFEDLAELARSTAAKLGLRTAAGHAK
jgi:hypothetical protein